MSAMGEHYYFVTGRLAERSLRRTVEAMAKQGHWQYTIDVLPITVAALMTPRWIARQIGDTSAATQIVLPGYCDGDLRELQQKTNRPIRIGPKDLHALPESFGQTAQEHDFGDYQIEILAEINHAPRLPLEEIRRQALQLAQEGADLIDLGCEPGHIWSQVADCVRALRQEGLRISIDSFDVAEILELPQIDICRRRQPVDYQGAKGKPFLKGVCAGRQVGNGHA